jgi:hypothetical protein
MNSIDRPIGCLGASSSAADIVVNPVKIRQSVFIELDSGHGLNLTLLRNPLASQPLATPTLHIVNIERHPGLASIGAVAGRLKVLPELVEIALISAECLDGLLRGEVQRGILELLTEELVERLDLAACVGCHESILSFMPWNFTTILNHRHLREQTVWDAPR